MPEPTSTQIAPVSHNGKIALGIFAVGISNRFVASTMAVVLFSLMTGCVSPLSPQQSAVRVPTHGTGTIAVSVVDNRPYVLSGRKTNRFEGITHELYGIPWNRGNFEKKPFAQFLGSRISEGFKKAGYSTIHIASPQGASIDAIAQAVRSSGTDRGFVVRLNEWYYDFGGFVVMSCEFFYDFDVLIFEANGRLIANRHFAGKELTPIDMANSLPNILLIEYQKKFDEVFADAGVQAALGGHPDLRPQAEPTATARLKRLDTLFDEHMISKEEYNRERQRILSGL